MALRQSAAPSSRSCTQYDMIEFMNRPDLEDFRRQCERQLARPVSDRIRYGFFRNPNPVRDSNQNRSFGSMSEYRRFCEESYPEYFGYTRPASATPAGTSHIVPTRA